MAMKVLKRTIVTQKNIRFVSVWMNLDYNSRLMLVNNGNHCCHVLQIHKNKLTHLAFS